MKYFIDHAKKKIHRKQYVGDRCGFIDTSIEKREFTDSVIYIERLEGQEQYKTCQYCKSAQSIIK